MDKRIGESINEEWMDGWMDGRMNNGTQKEWETGKKIRVKDKKKENILIPLLNIEINLVTSQPPTSAHFQLQVIICT